MSDPDRTPSGEPPPAADGLPANASLQPSSRTYLPEDWLGAIAMALLALITFANVLTRYFTNESFAWSEELSVSLMVILTLVAAGAAVVRERHIRIEFFYEGGSPARRRVLGLLSSLAMTGVFLAIFGLGLRLLWDDFRYEVTSPGIGVPQWWYTVWLPVLSLTVAARAVQRFVQIWRGS